MAKAKSSGTKKSLSKSALLQAVTESVGDGTTRKQVKTVMESLTEIGHRELKKNGLFVLPGFAKFVVVKRPARPARKGINPFTKEPTTFAAKPASKAIKLARSRRSKTLSPEFFTRTRRKRGLGHRRTFVGLRVSPARRCD